MPTPVNLEFVVEQSPVMVVTVIGQDGTRYELKLASQVKAIVDTGMRNPIDGMPVINIEAPTFTQLTRKTDRIAS